MYSRVVQVTNVPNVRRYARHCQVVLGEMLDPGMPLSHGEALHRIPPGEKPKYTSAQVCREVGVQV